MEVAASGIGAAGTGLTYAWYQNSGLLSDGADGGIIAGSATPILTISSLSPPTAALIMSLYRSGGRPGAKFQCRCFSEYRDLGAFFHHAGCSHPATDAGEHHQTGRRQRDLHLPRPMAPGPSPINGILTTVVATVSNRCDNRPELSP